MRRMIYEVENKKTPFALELEMYGTPEIGIDITLYNERAKNLIVRFSTIRGHTVENVYSQIVHKLVKVPEIQPIGADTWDLIFETLQIMIDGERGRVRNRN